MARTAVAVTTVADTGTDPDGVAVAAELTDGNSYPWAQHRLLYVNNGDIDPLTVTIPTPGTVGRAGLSIGDVVLNVPAGGRLLAGPFGAEVRQADGTVHVDYTGTTPTAVTVAVLDA